MNFPDTIQGFGYDFNDEGKLRNVDTGEPFEFEVKKDNHQYNQARYEALGELVTPHIYGLLEKRCGLKRQSVPIKHSKNDPLTFIFCSEDFLDAEKLLVLIHGSGVVRAGQWARRLIINDSLNSGTQIPFIERGIEEGYGIVVMNTNHNRDQKGRRIRTIEGSQDPEAHGKYVWKNYIKKCKASKIAIVAHSYGGVVTVRLFEGFKKDFVKRVFAVAMTDSVHFQSSDLTELIKVGKNWVSSMLPLDTPVPRRGRDVPCVSAGCNQHEMTSWSSFKSIFEFFSEKLQNVGELSETSSKLPSGSKRQTEHSEIEHEISSSENEVSDDENKEKIVEESQKFDDPHTETFRGGDSLKQDRKRDENVCEEIKEQLEQDKSSESVTQSASKQILAETKQINDSQSESLESMDVSEDSEALSSKDLLVKDEPLNENGAKTTAEHVKDLKSEADCKEPVPYANILSDSSCGTSKTIEVCEADSSNTENSEIEQSLKKLKCDKSM